VDGRVIRRLQEFESPYISLERVDKATHKLMVCVCVCVCVCS
jgi:hypothetical protein